MNIEACRGQDEKVTASRRQPKRRAETRVLTCMPRHDLRLRLVDRIASLSISTAISWSLQLWHDHIACVVCLKRGLDACGAPATAFTFATAPESGSRQILATRALALSSPGASWPHSLPLDNSAIAPIRLRAPNETTRPNFLQDNARSDLVRSCGAFSRVHELSFSGRLDGLTRQEQLEKT